MTTANNAAKLNNSENNCRRVYIFLSASLLISVSNDYNEIKTLQSINIFLLSTLIKKLA